MQQIKKTDEDKIRRLTASKKKIEAVLNDSNISAEERAIFIKLLALVNDIADVLLPHGRGQLNRH